MPHKNRDEKLKCGKEWWDKNKDEINRKRRERYKNDKEYREKRIIADKKYYDKKKKGNDQYWKELYKNNKDKDKEYKKKYVVGSWIQRRKYKGVKFTTDPKEYYTYYQEKKECDFCNKVFNDGEKKCVEHHHSSGYIRGICCPNCNGNLRHTDSLKLNVFMELHRYFFREI